MRRYTVSSLVAVLMTLSATATATTFRFDTDPFFGSTALTTAGRQIVGGETFITFNIASDLFSLESTVFGVPPPVLFFSGLVSGVPGGGANTIVLQSFDNDANPATSFGAGNAANLIADQITSPGAGFFIYFNSGLEMPRLVYSTDLSDSTADLKILFRMTNLAGQPGRDAIPTFTAANFEITTVPEPSAAWMMMAGALFAGQLAWRRRRHSRDADRSQA